MAPSGTPPAPSLAVLWVLLGLNAAVYVAWQAALRQPGDAAVDFMAANFRVSLDLVAEGRVWTLLTCAFSHVDPGHLMLNMLALWVFGRDVLLRIGSFAFVHLYVVGGILASLGHIAWQIASSDEASGVAALGASGSVMAISVLYAAMFPKRILLVGFLVPMPAAVAVAAYIVLDIVGAFGGVNDRVAHAAHLGGAAYGLAYWLLRLRRRAPVEPPTR